MTRLLPPVVPATPADVTIAAGIIAEAFHHLEAAAWLVEDCLERYQTMRGQFRILVEHALDHGEVHLLADQSAVAVWMHHGQAPVPEPDDYDRRLAAACGRHTERFRILDRLLHEHHPVEPAHHHLAFLAVLPPWQATGRGSALLAHHHQHLNATGTPAYLEASSPRSRDLYTRFGYRAAGQAFRLPDGPAFWPMWRQPHPAVTNAPGLPSTAAGRDPATH